MKKLQLSALLFLSSILLAKAQPANNWWNKSVFYEVFVRSYFDSDNNGIGDFKGLSIKLNHLNDGNDKTNTDLGIKGIWLMPINSSPSYHGYDVTNYKNVNSQYGTLADFRALVDSAHQKGIKVIIDFVINHTSSQHPWFIKSLAKDPFYRDFYIWNDTKPNVTGPWGQQVWYNRGGSNYYALFWSEMPDLNYKYKPVQDSIFDAAKFWIDSMKVDGFRLDAAMYLFENGNSLMNQPQTFEFWTSFNNYCKSLNPNFMTVGEVWTSSSAVKQYNGVLDNCFEFDLATSILNSVKTEDTYQVRNSILYAYQNLQNNRFSTFLTNHDQNRVFNEFNGDINKLKTAASIYLTLPGTPYLYYGEEIAMTGAKPDENIRTPMQWNNTSNAGFSTVNPWTRVNSNYSSYNVEQMKTDSNSILNHYKKLIQTRNNYPSLSVGTYQNVLCNEAAVMSFLRKDNNEIILVCINTSGKKLENVSLGINSLELTDGDFIAKNILTNGAESFNINGGQADNVSMMPYETKMLKMDKNLSVKVVFMASNLDAFPNPFNTSLNIELNNEQLLKNMVLEVFNAQGQLISKKDLKQTSKQEINLEAIPAGIYTIKIGNIHRQMVKY